MCIQTCALCLVGVKNIQVALIKNGILRLENPDLDLSLAALDINVGTSGASGSRIGSSTPRATIVGQASCSIFDDVSEEYM